LRALNDYYYLAKDFWRYLRGTDYFRQPQGLGPYFHDSRCYYNDLRGKSTWNGQRQDGVPALYVPSSGTVTVSPCMVLLWALGSLDRFFLEGDKVFLTNAESAARWLVASVLPEGYWDGDFQEFDPSHRYYSNNSCMNQGLALSFMSRLLRYELLEPRLLTELDSLSRRVALNMMRPLHENGTALRKGQDLYLLECTRVDESVVFNGWVYGLFGLWDHVGRTDDLDMAKYLKHSLATMQKSLFLFRRKDGWSYYDTMERIASPFYHDLHISLLDALHRLTGESVFEEQRQVFQRSNTRVNRMRYTLSKIKDKLLDQEKYSSQS